MSAEHEVISGSLALQDGCFTARLERVTEHSPELVWKMLTDSVHLASWLAPGTLDARTGGRVQLDFGNSGTPIDCRISACEPHRLLAHSWSAGDDSERTLRWELAPDGLRSRLLLTRLLPDRHPVPIAV